MQIIVLAGLVSIEKHQLAIELAHHYHAQGRRVFVLDNVARLALDSEAIDPAIHLTRQTGATMAQVSAWLASLAASEGVAIVTLDEQMHPEAIFMALDDLAQQYRALRIHMMAMIDLRTCDCFPHVRTLLGSYADSIVMMPYEFDTVLAQIVYTEHEH